MKGRKEEFIALQMLILKAAGLASLTFLTLGNWNKFHCTRLNERVQIPLNGTFHGS